MKSTTMASIQELWKPSSSTSTSMLELAGLLLGLWGEEEGTRDGEDESGDEGGLSRDLHHQRRRRRRQPTAMAMGREVCK